MENRRSVSHLGIYIYAAGSIALGLIGLVWGDFATDWQRVTPGVPFRPALAYFVAGCELFAGIALLFTRGIQVGASLLTLLYSVFTLLWVPKILAAPSIYDSWGNYFEEFSMVIAGLVLCSSLAPRGSLLARNESLIARLYGICVVSFALVHIIYFSGLPNWVPQWIPPGQKFWAFTTTVCFVLAAASILTGVLSALAARLLTAMIMGFELLVWLPKLFTAPHDHFSWSGNGIALAMAGAAWVVSDSISEAARHKPALREVRSPVGSAA